MTAGVMLLLFWLVVSVGLSAMTVGGRDLSGLVRAAFGVGAVSSYPMVWWCCRFWYVAFSERRRAEPVEEPGAWPWMPPMVVLSVALGVGSVRELARGNSGGWFGIGLGLVLGVPSVMLLVFEVRELVSGRATRNAPEPAVRPAEPPRPQRNWGPTGR